MHFRQTKAKPHCNQCFQWSNACSQVGACGTLRHLCGGFCVVNCRQFRHRFLQPFKGQAPLLGCRQLSSNSPFPASGSGILPPGACKFACPVPRLPASGSRRRRYRHARRLLPAAPGFTSGPRASRFPVGVVTRGEPPRCASGQGRAGSGLSGAWFPASTGTKAGGL